MARVLSAEAGVPEAAQRMLCVLADQVAHLDEQIAALDAQVREAVKADAAACRLCQVPGIGPLGAMTLSLMVEASQFRSGRHFAAWLGLVPRQRSSGGKTRLGGISRAGNERLRQLLVVGAMAVIRHVKPGGKNASGWLLGLLERRPRKLVAVALANKMARVVWAMLARGEAYRGQPAVGLSPGAVSRGRLMGGDDVGRTDERNRPRIPTADWMQAVSLFGCRSRNPSGPAASRRTTKAGHMIASEPTSSAAQPLEPTGPSTHGIHLF